jgi:anaerobic ribonucleoside-triphosphate reductase activating protein
MARDTWDTGERTTLAELLGFVSRYGPEEVAGVTVSGGEPFDQPAALAGLVSWLRDSFCGADRDILVYSGHRKEHLLKRFPDILSRLDALISDPFRPNVAGAAALRWRGSRNQRLTLLSDLGRERYSNDLASPSRGEVQLAVDGDRMRLIGVPRADDMFLLEQHLRDRGIELHGASWR